MASCDDDFSLLGDDNTTAATTTATHPPNPNTNLIHHQRQSFAHRNIAGPNDNDVVSPDADGYSDSAFCSSQPNSKSNNTASFHVVAVNPYDTDQNPFDTDPDPNKSRLNSNNIHTQHDKRTDREEVSDSGTPYPYKRPRVGSSACGSSGGEYRKDREEWSDSAIACLLEAYTEKFMMLNRGNLRGRDWEEVAAMVSERCDKQTKSVEQCKNKVDNLKKRYKLERHRLTNGGVSASHWPWFKQMEQIVGNSVSSKAAVSPDDEKSGGGVVNSGKQSKRYITFAYIERKNFPYEKTCLSAFSFSLISGFYSDL